MIARASCLETLAKLAEYKQLKAFLLRRQKLGLGEPGISQLEYQRDEATAEKALPKFA